MKRIINTLLILLVGYANISGQGCPDFPFTIVDQSTLNDFRKIWPDCKKLTHTIQIAGAGITSLDSLIVLEEINTLRITNVPNLRSLRGLENVRVQTGDFVLDGTGVVDLAQYQPSWVDSTRSIVIQNNPSLMEVTGFGALKKMGALTVNNNFALRKIDGFHQVDSLLGGRVLINLRDSYGFDTLRVFRNLAHAGSLIHIRGNSSMKVFEGFEEMVTGDSLRITEILLTVTKIPQFNKLQYLKKGLNVSFHSNQIESYNGFNSLISANYIYFSSNTFKKLEIFNKINIINNVLQIFGASCDSINSLDNFKGPITGEVEITLRNGLIKLPNLQNARRLELIKYWTTLDELADMDWRAVKSDIEIRTTNSEPLSGCVNPFICGYVLNTDLPLSMPSNSVEGCRTREEIREACLRVSSHEPAAEGVWLYPNPTESEAYIHSAADADHTEIRVYDISGRELSVYELGSGDRMLLPLSELPSGVYIIRRSDDRGRVQHEKLVKS